MATRNIQAFKLRSELVVDASKHHAEYQKAEREVAQYGKTVQKTGKDVGQAFKGADAGRKWGADFGGAAVSAITGSISALGTTIGSMIGTAIAPGIGTAIGSTIGSGLDAALGKIAGPILEGIKGGIELNKELERTKVEFTTFAGSAEQADKYIQDLKKHSIETGTSFTWVLETSEHIYDLTDNLELTNKILKAATDQAADFGGKAETIGNIAEQLGLIAEKGSLAGKELNKLYKLGIDAKKYLAEATGLGEKRIEQLMKENRLRGDIAAKLIAEGIERKKGGFAARLADTTAFGKEAKAQTALQIRFQEATAATTQGIGDLYGAAADVLTSAKAQQFTQFIDKTMGSLIDWTKRGVSAGVSLGTGVAEGLISGKTFEDLGASFTKLGSWSVDTLKSVFQIESPSKLMIKEIGGPLGEGLGVGLNEGLKQYLKGKGGDELVETLRGLLTDPRVQALLNTIAKAEGGAIDIMAGGRHVASGAQHPGEVVPMSQWFRTSKGASSAAGLYQITRTNWRRLAPALGLTNFSDPEQQKMAALALMLGHPGGLAALQSGDIGSMMNLAAKDWTSTPGSRIGGGGQWSRSRWLGQYQANLAKGGGDITEANPLPVYLARAKSATGQFLGGEWNLAKQGAQYAWGLMQPPEWYKRAGITPGVPRQTDIAGGAGMIDWNKPGAKPWGTQLLDAINSTQEFVLTLGEEDAAVVNITGHAEKLTNTLAATDTAVMDASMLPMKATKPLLEATGQYASTSIAITKEYQKAAREQLIVGEDIIGKLAGAFGQISGFAPSGGQQVSKKRSLFSKILGIAAPFLSFIPGVGPILSTIAGAASGFVGGDISAGISSIAGGFAKGGAFRRAGGGGGFNPGIGQGGAVSTTPTINPNITMRQHGGPVYAGQPYLVGERGPELFIPGAGGSIAPHDMSAVLEGLRREISRLGSMPAEHVVMKGARGLSRAMDSDASLADQYGRRLRLA